MLQNLVKKFLEFTIAYNRQYPCTSGWITKYLLYNNMKLTCFAHTESALCVWHAAPV